MDIQVCKINKSFGAKQVLCDFSARFTRSRINCIMGSSGCGKTTLIRILLGLETPDSGEISGIPKKISAVFQEDRLCDPFSAVSNIALVTGKQMSQTTLRAHLCTLGLADSLDIPVSELSGGMRRRVAIARAMLYNAPLILLDEPFKGLDEATKRVTMDYVHFQAAGRTVLFVTHDAAEAAYLADTTLYMN